MVTPNRQQVVGSDAAIVEPVARETASWTRIPPRGLPDDVSNGQLISPDGNLALNVFPAHFSADAVEVFVGPHGRDEVYDALVAAEDGWSAWRDTDDGARVYVWRHRDNVRFARPEFRRASVSLEESPRLFSHLMLAGIDRQLEELGFARGQRDHPGPAVYTKWGTGNFLSGLGIDGFEPDLRVGIFPKIIVESLITRFGDASPRVYLIVDVAYTSILDIPVHELLTQKFSVIGRYVKLHEGPTATTGTSGRTIGRVSKVSGTELILEDRRDGVKERVAAETCVLEPGRLTIEAYLRHIHPNHYRAAKPALDGRLAMLMSPPEKLRLAEGFVSRRLGTTDEVAIPLAAGLTVKFSDPVTPSADAAPFRAS